MTDNQPEIEQQNSITDIYSYLSDKDVKIYDSKLDDYDIVNQFFI